MLTLAVAVCGLLASGVILIATGMNVRLDQAGPAAAMIVTLMIAHAFYSLVRDEKRLALLTGGLGLFIILSMNAAIVAHAGMRLKRPLIDSVLAGLDGSIGCDTPALVLLAAKAPWLSGMLGFIYSTTVPAVIATVLWLAFAREDKRLWQFVFVCGCGALVSAGFSVAFPAMANFVHAGLTPDKVPGLPAGSGRFFLSSVDYFRNGSNPVFDAAQLSGVVTFPSYHAVMALAVASAVLPNVTLRPFVVCWAALVLVSTVPIGGHYLVDIAGGAALFLMLVAMSEGVSRSAGQPHPTAAADGLHQPTAA